MSSIKTREGLEAAIALKFLRHGISVSVTFKKTDTPPYRATIQRDRRPIGNVTGVNLEQIQKKIEGWIEQHLSDS